MSVFTADEFVYNQSIDEKKHPYLFESKQYIYQADSQGGTYSTPQVSFETNIFSSQDRFIDFTQGFVVIPLVMTLNAAFTGQSYGNAFCMSLKNGYHHLVHSLTANLSNGDFVNQSSYTNMKINYDIVSSFSNDTVTNLGPSIGFHGIDDWKSITYNPVGNGSVTGLGEINNNLIPSAFTTTNGYLATGTSNQSRLKRMTDNTSYDPRVPIANSSISTFVLNNNTDKTVGNFFVTLHQQLK
jgi:hypothetical protein